MFQVLEVLSIIPLCRALDSLILGSHSGQSRPCKFDQDFTSTHHSLNIKDCLYVSV